MAQNKYLQLLRNASYVANYEEAVAKIVANAPTADGAPIVVRFTEDGETHALLGVSYGTAGNVHYVELGGERIKDVKEALNKAIEEAKAAAVAAATVVEQGEGVSVTSKDDEATGAKTYTVAADFAVVAKKDDLDTVSGTVTTLTQTVADNKAAAEDAIVALNAEVSGNSAHVTVTVKEDAGKLTGVVVAENDIASASALTAVKADVDTFFNNADLSASAIDTLKELQDYISSDKTGAASMEEAIADNKSNIEAVSGTVTTLTQTVADNKAAAEDAIVALNAEVSGNSAHVTVTVKEDAGKLTGVVVAENDIASAAALTAVDGRVTTIENDYLKKSDKTELEGAIADAKKAKNVTIADEGNVFEATTVEAALAELNTKIGEVAGEAIGVASGNHIALSVSGTTTTISATPNTMLSKDASNQLILGSDNLLYVAEVVLPDYKVVAGNGIEVTEKADESQTVSVKLNIAEDNTLSLDGDGLYLSNVWDCGTF